MIKDAQNRLWFSVASLWEISIKRGLDRPDLGADAGQMHAGLLANGYKELAIDRMLIAQAATEGMTLVTADRKVAQYPGPIELVWGLILGVKWRQPWKCAK